MASEITNFGSKTLSAISEAGKTTGKYALQVGLKVKEITLLALSKIGEFLSISAKAIGSYSKVAYHYSGVALHHASEYLAAGASFAATQTAKAALLAKGLLATYPQYFAGLGSGIAVALAAVAVTVFLTK